MKIYKIYIYIPDIVFNKKLMYLLPELELYTPAKKGMRGFYGWTDKKEVLDQFKNERSIAVSKDVYIFKKKDGDEDDLQYMKLNHPNQEIKPYEFDNDSTDSSVTVMCTTYSEYLHATENSEDRMLSFGPQIYDGLSPYFFKDSVIEALEGLYYTSIYAQKNAKTIDMLDQFGYNRSFGIGPYGYKILIAYSNKFLVLIYLFAYMYMGTDYSVYYL